MSVQHYTVSNPPTNSFTFVPSKYLVFHPTTIITRFGFDGKGKPLVARTTMQRGFRTICTNGDSIVGDTVYSADRQGEAIAAANAAAAKEKEEMERFDSDTEEVLRGTKSFATVAERFTAEQRREHGKVNSYNAIISYCIRSNMDIKILLRDSDARGCLFYILSYTTKSEDTMNELLNVLAPVVERIKDETEGAPAKVIAAQLVRSCSCKTLSQMTMGGPAAASKVLGYTDSKCSHETHNCPMAPLIAESSKFFENLPTAASGQPSTTSDQQGEIYENDDIDDDEEDDRHDIMLNTAGNKIKISTSLHQLYLRRCRPDDHDHPYFGMSYVVWARLVRVETSGGSRHSQQRQDDSSTDDSSRDDFEHDSEDDGDSQKESPVPKPNEKSTGRPPCSDLDDSMNSSDDDGDSSTKTPPSKPGKKKGGRPPCPRYDFVGEPKLTKQQVIDF